MTGESQQLPDSKPDPSVLTTEQMLLSVAHLEKLLTQKIDDLRAQLDERYETQTKAVDAALAAQQTAMQTAFAAAEKAVEQRAATLDREFHEHLEQVRHENALAFLNADKAVTAALIAVKEAATKKEQADDKRFESVNEFRAQQTGLIATFLPRSEADVRISGLSEKVSEISTRLDLQTGRSTGYSALYGWLVAGIGLLITVVVAANIWVGR